MPNDQILRLPEVKQRTKLSRTAIYMLVQQNKFPKNFKLGARSMGWLQSDIDAWIEERAAAAKSPCTKTALNPPAKRVTRGAK